MDRFRGTENLLIFSIFSLSEEIIFYAIRVPFVRKKIHLVLPFITPATEEKVVLPSNLSFIPIKFLTSFQFSQPQTNKLFPSAL
jgi:hypothetical protein